MTPGDPSAPRWFVLNSIGNNAFGRNRCKNIVDAFNAEGHDLQLFAPSFVKPVEHNGKTSFSERPLTFHYIFVRGTEFEIRTLCARDNGLSPLLSRSDAQRYAIVGDREMANFRIIARAYSNRLPFFSISAVQLEEGDEVEVIDGEFAGLTGIYMPRAGSRKGNIVVAADLDHATALFDVSATSVRIIRYARNSRRAYDNADAFAPRLYRALRTYHAGRPLSPEQITDLTVFADRMATVRPDNPKFAAKLAALLLGANALLGRQPQAADARALLAKHEAAVTNPWTRALLLLIKGIADADPALLAEGRALIGPDPEAKESQAKAALRAEYVHYATPAPNR